MGSNYFSIPVIKSHLLLLSASPSLRLLELRIPETLSDGIYNSKPVNEFSALINTIFNQKRSEFLYVDMCKFL